MATSPEKSVERDIQALRKDVSALAESIRQLAADSTDIHGSIRKSVGKGLNGAAHAGEDFVSDAAKLGKDTAHVAEKAAETGLSMVAGEIKRNPFVAVIAALGVGFLAGVGQRR
jgi:ElaB/YqjD/DUF883 family membrane-anchored ribosome-binding protein